MTRVLTDAQYRFCPLWDAERDLPFGYLCQAYWSPDSAGQPATRDDPSADFAKYAAAADRQTLDAAGQWVEQALAALVAPLVIVPVHLATLAEDDIATHYLDRVYNHLAAMIDDVFFEVLISGPAPREDALIRALGKIAPLSRGVQLRVSPSTTVFPALKDYPLTSIGIDLSEFAADQGAALERLDVFAKASRNWGPDRHVHGLYGTTPTNVAFKLGYRYIGSDILGEPLESGRTPEKDIMTPEHLMKLRILSRGSGDS